MGHIQFRILKCCRNSWKWWVLMNRCNKPPNWQCVCRILWILIRMFCFWIAFLQMVNFTCRIWRICKSFQREKKERKKILRSFRIILIAEEWIINRPIVGISRKRKQEARLILIIRKAFKINLLKLWITLIMSRRIIVPSQIFWRMKAVWEL